MHKFHMAQHVNNQCVSRNPDANLLAIISQKHRIHSKSYWFTETCSSKCLLHFAAPFMVIKAETYVAENVVVLTAAPSIVVLLSTMAAVT